MDYYFSDNRSQTDATPVNQLLP
jgi:hypothetical protein